MCGGVEKIGLKPRELAVVVGRSTYSARNVIWDPESVCITVMANWGAKSPPPPLWE